MTHDRPHLGEGTCILRNARIPVCLTAEHVSARGDALVLRDIRLADGRISAIGAPAPADAQGFDQGFDNDGGIVLPRLLDIHTHLDKGHIWPRKPNPDGTFSGAITSVAADRAAHWTRDDVCARMDFSLRCAFAHGTGAIRTHIDSLAPQAAISWPLFADMRAAWKDRIALQAVALFPVTMALDDEPQFRALLDLVVRHGGILGGLTFEGTPPDAKLDAALARVFEAAAAHGLDLDFHVDESESPDARSLGRIAETALKTRFSGKITAGHCCSLALAGDEERGATIARIVEAGIAVVSLPMVNMYLQDRRAGRTPRWRGVAPLHEIADAGGATMVASDNTRDPFHAYGDLDLIEVFREATRILHFDHSPHAWLKTMTATPAAAMRLPGHGRIAVGDPADLILTRARTLPELLSRPRSDRIVLVAGRPIDTRPPDYRELDALFAPAEA